jgi:hypothetical protein
MKRVIRTESDEVKKLGEFVLWQSVSYSDFLRHPLPWNKAFFNEQVTVEDFLYKAVWK